MGMDIHVELYEYNKEDNLFHRLAMYQPRKEESWYYNAAGVKQILPVGSLKSVSIYTARNQEMFDGMKDGDETDGYGWFPWVDIAINSLDEESAKKIQEKSNLEGYFDFYELSLADMKIYCDQHKKVADYDAKEEFWDKHWNKGAPKPIKPNPIIDLYETICQYAHFASWKFEYNPLSYYKVIFYFDC